MSFPIYRADLQVPSFPKLDFTSATLPESSNFIEKRVFSLSKQIIRAAISGNKSLSLSILREVNIEPISSGLKVNFPDVTFTVVNKDSKQRASDPSSAISGGIGSQILVSWE